jgi:hypothetical protein
MHVRTLILAITLALGLAAAPPGAPASEDATRLTLGYEVYAGGLKGVEFDYRLELGEGRYRTDFTGEIVGAYGWLIDFSMTSGVEGALAGGAPEPESYAMRSRWNDNPPRAIDILWGEDRRARAEVAPVPGEEAREPVPAELLVGAVDPLSAALSLSQTVAETGRCAGAAEVFDGRRRFDLIVEDGGEAMIEANDYQVYEGPARRCLIDFVPVAGFKQETEEGRPEEQRFDKTIRVYLAPVEAGLPPLPVRMEFDHRLGAVRVHLARIDRN